MPTSLEIHHLPSASEQAPSAGSAHPSSPPANAAVFVVPDNGAPAWLDVAASGQLLPADPGSARVGFMRVARRHGQGLAMIARDEAILVNGLPAAPFTVLTTRDAITLAPNMLHYATERFKPYIGSPTDDMLQQHKKCPCCQLPFEPASRVITCYCSQPYHWETADSHPDKPDRLECFERVRKCLSPSCGRAMTRGEESLTWDPRDL